MSHSEDSVSLEIAMLEEREIPDEAAVFMPEEHVEDKLHWFTSVESKASKGVSASVHFKRDFA
eukprot:CAMPEP_0185599922 /NCGR_PEP_ID=MMETSP0434-20130131/83039_1 /TAXON_ID=626734 ORGANISM="Favella taraikaensis, Strain Fe Narragansett Bay" /NCGR_SAMPLE_ID=MMETSP0434 /ASSEMBLY_ACC=CAM_ASM_000379 /LENGTH=62 /DNA_ID=CAMNT_0028229507 /DNA_START=731 /DNA_END=919 /DNA_ORIENTATION=-